MPGIDDTVIVKRPGRSNAAPPPDSLDDTAVAPRGKQLPRGAPPLAEDDDLLKDTAVAPPLRRHQPPAAAPFLRALPEDKEEEDLLAQTAVAPRINGSQVAQARPPPRPDPDEDDDLGQATVVVRRDKLPSQQDRPPPPSQPEHDVLGEATVVVRRDKAAPSRPQADADVLTEDTVVAPRRPLLPQSRDDFPPRRPPPPRHESPERVGARGISPARTFSPVGRLSPARQTETSPPRDAPPQGDAGMPPSAEGDGAMPTFGGAPVSPAGKTKGRKPSKSPRRDWFMSVLGMGPKKDQEESEEMGIDATTGRKFIDEDKRTAGGPGMRPDLAANARGDEWRGDGHEVPVVMNWDDGGPVRPAPKQKSSKSGKNGSKRFT